MRVLFSFSRIVSKPKTSSLTQSRPTQALPCTIRSSAITSSGIAPVDKRWLRNLLIVFAETRAGAVCDGAVCPADFADRSLSFDSAGPDDRATGDSKRSGHSHQWHCGSLPTSALGFRIIIVAAGLHQCLFLRGRKRGG